MFVTLEGPDGAGKSSQAAALAERLRAAGVEVVLTREPGGTALGERVRELLLRTDAPERTTLADALLFNAARQQLVEEVIRPALDAGKWVLCDRFADSTLAYQGYGGGVPLDDLRALARVATRGLVPDRTLLFDVPVEAGLARRSGGPSAELTRFELAERHDLAFHQRVRDGFLALAAAEPARWSVIDASHDAGAVTEEAWRGLEEWLVARSP
ncbi:MAG TPA: dTMP kinase [Candidatus Limnocylindria bacterium]|nr:dTMP kinase [Candidatus Limnocylindria bacterium]